MVTMIVALTVVAIPVAGLLALFWVLWAIQDRRERVARAQIAVTDAIHRQLGAVVAPTVRPRLGAWQLRVAVPWERPRTEASVLEIVHEVLSSPDVRRRPPFEIVLTPQLEAPRPLAFARARRSSWVA